MRIGIVIAVALTLSGVPAAAQERFVTPWGHPDLQGVWDYRSVTPLERPESLGERAAFTAEEAQEFVDTAPARAAEAAAPFLVVGGEPWADVGTKLSEGSRASLIYDPPSGRLPQRTEWGMANQQETMKRFLGVPGNPEERPEQERCLVYPRIPLQSGNYNNNLQIVQTPTHVVLHMEMVHDARVVPLQDTPRLDYRTWVGQSRGRFEGDTLVVETKGFRHSANMQGYSRDRVVVERFTRIDEHTLDYDYTVDDPTAFAAPFSARQSLVERGERIFEYACHEGNYSLPAMLRGARVEEQSAGE